MTQKVIRCQLVAFVQSYRGRNWEVLRLIPCGYMHDSIIVPASSDLVKESEFITIDLSAIPDPLVY